MPTLYEGLKDECPSKQARKLMLLQSQVYNTASFQFEILKVVAAAQLLKAALCVLKAKYATIDTACSSSPKGCSALHLTATTKTVYHGHSVF